MRVFREHLEVIAVRVLADGVQADAGDRDRGYGDLAPVGLDGQRRLVDPVDKHAQKDPAGGIVVRDRYPDPFHHGAVDPGGSRCRC